MKYAQTCLVSDLIQLAEEAVRKRGRRLAWLRFAKRRISQGYAFFLENEVPWEIWHEVVAKAHSLHPEFSYAQVVDIASESLNQEELPEE